MQKDHQATVPVGTLNVAVTDLDAAVAAVVHGSKSRTVKAVHLVNAYTVALADADPAYSELLNQGLLLPDGKPLSWVSRIRGDRPYLRQTRGPSLFELVFDRGRVHDLTHFLLGSTPEVLAQLVPNLERRFTGVRIVGAESPPFRTLSEAEMLEQDNRIRQSKADVVWVGLGTPKQDLEAARLARSLGVAAIAVGAAFDFTAGTARTAPRWMTAVGLEWLFRLLSEPRRLWRRYLFGNVRFMIAAARGGR